MLSYRLGTVNDFHRGYKPVLSYSKPHTLHIFWRRKRKKMHLISPTSTTSTTLYIPWSKLTSFFFKSKYYIVYTMDQADCFISLYRSATLYIPWPKLTVLFLYIEELHCIYHGPS